MTTYTGDMIKKIRKEKGLTQKQLGELCGMADSAVRRYENGNQNPKIETLEKIAAALDVPVTRLRAGILPDIEEIKEKVSEWGVNNLMAQSLEERELLDNCRKLNIDGKREAAKRVEELTHLEKYTK